VSGSTSSGGAWSPDPPEVGTGEATPELNRAIASRFDEVSRLLGEQGANPFRVRSWRAAAGTLRALARPVDDLLTQEGLARAIEDLVTTGRLPMLERLRGEADPEALLRTVPGIGPALARRLHDDLGLATLEDLEAAAHDGRLERLGGFGAKRLGGIRDALAARLGRARGAAPRAVADAPPVAELLDVDREYRAAAARGELPRIAPRRFNPEHDPWLPVLHTTRGERHYTALFSNTARAHGLGKTHDWVVLFCDGLGPEQRFTVVTAGAGPLAGRRVVRGREAECLRLARPSRGEDTV
jgi:putative hydrolase